MNMKQTRTRFAPSPTGYLHVGGIRTALFAWLVARQNHGQFVLRLEDTDKQREVSGAEQHIIDSLATLSIDHDEGPDKGGDYGPYRQSQRLSIYREWAQRLIDTDRAYADPYSPDEVAEFRRQAQATKQPFLYRNHRPAEPPTWDGTQPLRFKSNPRPYTWQDEVMGKLSTGPEVIDDFIILKSDGYPTYNFAHIVDDRLMQISHVIRGQEFISSMPNYLNLYEALDIEPPIFATMPHIMNAAGNKKLSKRDGAKDVLDYVKDGYPAEALVSFIATLGWNDGTEQELFTVSELIKKFSLNRVGRSGAQFDERRLTWVSGSFIRQLSTRQLLDRAIDYLPPEAKEKSTEYNLGVVELAQERLKYFAELPELTAFFYRDLPVDSALISSHKQLSKLSQDELTQLLATARKALTATEFDEPALTGTLNTLLEKTGQKPAVIFSLIRIAATQAPHSPALAATLAQLGRDSVLRRIDTQLRAFAQND
jgi:glutamyl-tRNA synthetase